MNEETKNETFVIAEMACSHEGEPSLAETIIRGAGDAGANAVQFQIWKLSEMMVPNHPSYELLEKIEMTQDEWSTLITFQRLNFPEMEVIACVNDIPSIEFCEAKGVDAYKLHSSDLSNPQIINAVAETGKRIDLSVGASTEREIDRALAIIRSHENEGEIWLMYGYQSFPTPTDGIHLRFLKTLKDKYGLKVGYQDHSDADLRSAFELPAASMGLEIDILEKHITHDRSLKGIDHQSALNPLEFKEFVKMVRMIDNAKGVPGFRPFSEKEEDYRVYSKKSIVASMSLKAGTILKKEHFLFRRTEKLGVPPDQMDTLIGKELEADVGKNERIPNNSLT